MKGENRKFLASPPHAKPPALKRDAMNPEKSAPNGDVSESLRSLLQAGLELGIAEAVRRLAQLAPLAGGAAQQTEDRNVIGTAALAEFVRQVREDSGGVLQLVKEVWSRGGAKERKTAARALGRGVGKVAPHKALGLTRDLASMARNAKEADWVGTEAIGPILAENPALFERAKQFLQDAQPWVRRAAIAGLVAYVTRKKKLAGIAAEIVILMAESHEKEIRQAARWAVGEISKVDWKATAGAIVAWVRQNPTKERVAMAKKFAASSADAASRNVQKLVLTGLARFSNGSSKPTKR